MIKQNTEFYFRNKREHVICLKAMQHVGYKKSCDRYYFIK